MKKEYVRKFNEIMLTLMLFVCSSTLAPFAEENIEESDGEETLEVQTEESLANEEPNEITGDEDGVQEEDDFSEITQIDEQINEGVQESDSSKETSTDNTEIIDFEQPSYLTSSDEETYDQFHIESGANNTLTIVSDGDQRIDMAIGYSYSLLLMKKSSGTGGGGTVVLQQVQGQENKVIIDPSSYTRANHWSILVEPGEICRLLLTSYKTDGSDVKHYNLGEATYDKGFDCTVKKMPNGTTIRNVNVEDPSEGIVITCDKTDTTCSAYLEELVNHEFYNNPSLNRNNALIVYFTADGKSASVNPFGSENFEFFDKVYEDKALTSLKFTKKALESLNLPSGNYNVHAQCTSMDYEMPRGENVQLYLELLDAPSVTVSYDENKDIKISCKEEAYLQKISGYNFYSQDGEIKGGISGGVHNIQVDGDSFYITVSGNSSTLKHNEKFYLVLKAKGYQDAVLSDQLLTYPFFDVPDDLKITAIADGIALISKDETFLQDFIDGFFTSPYMTTNIAFYDNTSRTGRPMPLTDQNIVKDIQRAGEMTYALLGVSAKDFEDWKMNTESSWVLGYLDVKDYTHVYDYSHSFSVAPIMLYSGASGSKQKSAEELANLDHYTQILSNITVTSNVDIAEEVASENIGFNGILSGALLTDNAGGVDKTEISSQNNDNIVVTTSIAKTSSGTESAIINDSKIKDAKATGVSFDINITKNNITADKKTTITVLPYKAELSFDLPEVQLKDDEHFAVLSKHDDEDIALPVRVEGGKGYVNTSKFSSFVLVTTSTSLGAIINLIMDSYDISGAEIGLYTADTSRDVIRNDMRTGRTKAIKTWTSSQGTAIDDKQYSSDLTTEDIEQGDYIVAVRKNGYISSMIFVQVSSSDIEQHISMRELGDADGVSRVDVADLSLTSGYILGSKTVSDESTDAADYNQDGVIDVADLAGISGRILSGE